MHSHVTATNFVIYSISLIVISFLPTHRVSIMSVTIYSCRFTVLVIHYALAFYFAPLRVRSIAISVSVCLSVCPLAYLANHNSNFAIFLYTLAVAMARSSCDKICGTLHTFGFVDYVIFLHNGANETNHAMCLSKCCLRSVTCRTCVWCTRSCIVPHTRYWTPLRSGLFEGQKSGGMNFRSFVLKELDRLTCTVCWCTFLSNTTINVLRGSAAAMHRWSG